MDGSAFRKMDLSGLFSWPVLGLLAIGALPLNPVPSILKTINIDLALCATALTSDKMFDELERRAENWRKHLIMIAKGHAGLGIHEDASTDDPSPATGTGASTGMFAKVVRI
jgi:phage gp36-like protein